MMRKLILYSSVFMMPYLSFSQVLWTKYPNNPVVSKGGSSWEAAAIGQPTCLLENDTMKMWYVAVDGLLKARISYAWSLDGLIWNKYNNATPVLDLGDQGSWDSGWLDAPEIVHSADGYLLYYYGDTTQQSPEISSAYGVASSPDGINWTRYSGNPVFQKSDSVEFDGKWVESPAVLYEPNLNAYFMWYSGVAWNWQIKNGLAISFDGYNWIRNSVNPVTEGGPWGSFDDMWVSVPAIIHSPPVVEMWYCGFSSVSGFDTIQIGYAVSMDGVNWIKYSGNPIYSRYFPPYDTLVDNDGVWAPDVVYNESSNEYLMWYEGTNGFHLATSPRSVLYSPDCVTGVTNDTTVVSGQSLTLEATGGTLYQWMPVDGLSDPDISNPTVSPDTTVTYMVLIVSDSCINVDTVTITILPSGMETSQNQIQSLVYPNPFREKTTIEFTFSATYPATFELFDALGVLLRRVDKLVDSQYVLERKDLPEGMYFYRLSSEDGRCISGKLFAE